MDTLTYKGKPLVREGRFIFYGNPTDKLILFMNILETKKEDDLEMATKVLVQIQKTDEELDYSEKIVKQAEKKNFFEAFELGSIWLERELNK